MPEGSYQLVVDTVTVTATPRNGHAHPWRTTKRHGVATCERSPGLAAVQSSRPRTPDEAAARDAAVSAYEGSASEVGERLGMSRSAVLGCRYRHRARGGVTVPAPTPVPRGPREEARRVVAASRTTAEIAARLCVGQRQARRLRQQCAVLPAVPVTDVAAPPPEPEPAPAVRVSLIDAAPYQCRAIEGSDGLCCGASTSGTSSWCTVHRQLYTSRDTYRRRAA